MMNEKQKIIQTSAKKNGLANMLSKIVDWTASKAIVALIKKISSKIASIEQSPCEICSFKNIPNKDHSSSGPVHGSKISKI